MSLNIDRVWDRLRPKYGPDGSLISGIADLKGRSLTDFRALVFPQNIVVPGSPNLNPPTQVGPLAQQFPGGAIVLSIAASCFPEGQPVNPFLDPRQRFQLQLSYGTQEQLIVNPGLADAVMGDGRENILPPKEMFLPPQQTVLATVINMTPEQIRVTIAYHCLVWRFAQ